MRISVKEAEDRLEELVQRAEAGEEVLLTLRGRIAVRIEPIKGRDVNSRRTFIE